MIWKINRGKVFQKPSNLCFDLNTVDERNDFQPYTRKNNICTERFFKKMFLGLFGSFVGDVNLTGSQADMHLCV